MIPRAATYRVAIPLGYGDGTVSVRGVARTLALVVVCLSALVDLPRDIQFGPVTSQAILTIVYFFAALLLLPMIPSRHVSRPLRSLALSAFFIWAATSLLWTTTISNGLQNVLAIGTFLVMLFLGEACASADPQFGFWLDKCLSWGVGIALALYGVSLMVFGAGSDDIVSARAFGLFALFGVGQQLARWRHGARLGLVWAILITFLIGASESRLALGIAVVLFPLAQVPVRNLARLGKMLVVLVLAALLSYGAFLYFDSLRDRFLTGDVSLTIGSVSINGSGRSAFWKLTADAFWDAPIWGHGAGTAGALIDSVYAVIHHPHNDYLRILHDYGLVGMSLWAIGMITILVSLWRQWRMGYGGRSARLVLMAILLLVAFCLEMTAENAMVYVFVVAPLGLIVGSALSPSGSRVKRDEIDRFPARAVECLR
jgi:O-antigen ligase